MQIPILVLCLIAMVSSYQIFGFKFFEGKTEESQDIQDIQGTKVMPNYQDQPNLGDEMAMGAQITSDIQGKIKLYVEQAYVFNGPDQLRNIQYIQQKLNIFYNGTFLVGIFGGQSYYAEPFYGKNLGVSSFSSGGQWWIYWKGANKYQPYYAYYISRQDGNSPSNYACVTSPYYYYNVSTNVFQNVVTAAEYDFTNIQNFTGQIQRYLYEYQPNTTPSVIAANSTVPFSVCTWGVNDWNYVRSSSRYGFTVVSMPRI